MDTTRANIAYRPLRICWAIKQDDKAAFRQAVRINHALWGGRFNPIVVVDRAAEAKAIAEVFRADVIYPIGGSLEVKGFADTFKHLINPFFGEELFTGRGDEARSRILDVHNAIVFAHEKGLGKYVSGKKPRLYSWAAHDGLADVFLMRFGGYPDPQVIGIDYESIFKTALAPSDVQIQLGGALPTDAFDYPNIAALSWQGLQRHYSVQPGWDFPGFFVGDASNLDDLIAFWNIRAADVAVLFVDPAHVERQSQEIPVWKERMTELISRRRRNLHEGYAIWWRRKHIAEEGDAIALRAPFGDDQTLICGIDEHVWNGKNLQPAMMHFKEVSSLGVVVSDAETPKVSFALSDRPYATDPWFFNQHLVASVSFFLGKNDDFTLDPPYVPELNEFYGREMHFHYNRFRIEPERIGLVITAADSDSFVHALSTTTLFKRLFKLAGYEAIVSSGGLIARQLIAQLGGLQGGRVFKIPGVRRLLKEYGPNDSFHKETALKIIGESDPASVNTQFKDHKNLYLEPREPGTELAPPAVFAYLVGKRLFRIGVDLRCPNCQLKNWFPVDDLRQRVTCQMCGDPFSTSNQLIDNKWAYRRSGVLGLERNAQGAVPVVLTLQQLDINLQNSLRDRSYYVSLDLTPVDGVHGSPCEVDFVWLMPCVHSARWAAILGECKDQGKAMNHGDGATIDASTVANLRAVADAFPKNRFDVYILLAKLTDFTANEIELAKSLNGQHQLRVILLTGRELEPYSMYERTKMLFNIDDRGDSPTDLARASDAIFLNPQPRT